MANRQVTVWFGSTAAALCLGDPAETLAPEEIEQARRFRIVDDQMRYMAGRMLLRHTLSQTTKGETAPSAWRFRQLPAGKLVTAPGLPAIGFNIAHSGDAVAVAVSADGDIGIDLEEMSPNLPQPFSDVLTEVEREWLGEVPRERARGAFISLWCAKEACAKALGLGVGLDFATIAIDPAHLRVYCRPEVVPTGRKLRLDLRHVFADGRWYCLSTAELKSGCSRVAIEYKALAEAA